MEASRQTVRSPRRIEQDRRYFLMDVAGAQFAYTDQLDYLSALGRAWNAGCTPDPLPSALGSELPVVAPALRGVDSAFTPA